MFALRIGQVRLLAFDSQGQQIINLKTLPKCSLFVHAEAPPAHRHVSFMAHIKIDAAPLAPASVVFLSEKDSGEESAVHSERPSPTV